MFIVYALAIGVAIGAAATVARRIGEKDPDRAAVAAVQAIIPAASRRSCWAASARSSARSRLRHGATDAVIVTGSTFSRVMLGGCGTVTLLFLINSVFRGAGDAAIAMRVLWFANTINIVLGPTLIFGLGLFPEMGVVGAATATTIGRGCGVLYQLLHLTRPGGRLHVRREHWRLDPEAMRSILRISGTATFQNFVATASWMGLIKILSGFGSAAVAGNTIGIRIVLFALLPSFGVSNAAATLVGQNPAPGAPTGRRRRRGRPASTTRCLGVVGVIFLVFAPLLIGIFTSDPEVAPYGIRACASSPPASSSTGMAWCSRRRSMGPAIPARPRGSTCSACGSGRFRWPGRLLPRRPGSDGRVRGGQRGVLRRWRSSAPDLLERDVEDEAG